MLEIKDLKFEHGAMSIIQLGQELIGHPSTAINELIKNGYDADAFDYWVYFNYSSNDKDSFIFCFDNGVGMDEKILFGNWLHPSVSNKRVGSNKSPLLNRSFLGSKGIGRLASMALGQYLTVITKTSEDPNYNWLVLDREKFRNENLLSSVEFPGGKSDSVKAILEDEQILTYKGFHPSEKIFSLIERQEFASFTEGTLIIVEQFDSSVKTIVEKDFRNEDVAIDDLTFLRSLKVLVTPLSLNLKIQEELLRKNIIQEKIPIANPESFFKVHFGINLIEENKFIEVKEVEILKHYDYRILGKVDQNADVHAHFHCQRLKEDIIEQDFVLGKTYVLSDEGMRVRKNKDIPEVPTDMKASKVGSFFFDIRIYDRDFESFEKLSKILNTKTKKETTTALDKFLGLRISKNGFNVKPYGEEEKDWMEMGQMRVQNPTEVIGTNQILGNVFLFSPGNDGLKEKTNREGFFENEAFINFKLILRAVLLDLGKKRFRYRLKHNIGRTINNKLSRPDSIKFLNFLKDNSTDKALLKKAEEYIEATNTTFENFENSLSFSERLAALGSGLELVYHELSQPLSIIGSSWFNLMERANDITQNEIRTDIVYECKTIKNSLSTLNELQESLEPAIGKGQTRSFKILNTFQKVILLLRHELKENAIKVEVSPLLEKETIISYEYVFWIAFLNILNNSVYWLKRVDKREIHFKIIEKNSFEISNTSAKINDDDLEAIFEYGVTMRQEKNATGLGLTYTKNMLSKIGYSIVAVNREYGPAFIISKES